MSKYNFDCHHFNGYTGVCNLKGGECHKCCKDWIAESTCIEPSAGEPQTISLTKLREVLNKMEKHGLVINTADEIINRIRQELI